MSEASGPVYIPVLPSAKDFFKKLQKDIVPDAGKVGVAAGKAISQEMVKYVDANGNVTIKPRLDRREIDDTLAKIRNSKGQFVKVGVKVDPAEAAKSGKKAGESAGKAAKKGAEGAAKGGFLSGMFKGSSSSALGKKEGEKLGHSYKEAVREQVKGIAGLFAGIYVLDKSKDFIKESLKAGEDQKKINLQTAATIKSTGGAAGVTSKHVEELAGSLSKQAGVADDDIQSMSNLLLTFKNIKNTKTNKTFDETTKAALDMSTAMKISGKSATLQLAKALNDPIKGMAKLTRAGVTFTKQQQDQIKHYVRLGDTAKAQQIILGEVQSKFGGSAAAVATPADKMKAAWHALQEQIGLKLLPLLDKAGVFITNKVLPPVSRFFDAFGKGHGSQIKAIATQVYDFAKSLGSQAFVTGKALFKALWPLFVSIGMTIKRDVLPSILKLGQYLQTNIIPWLKTLATWVKNNQTLVRTIAVGLLAMYAAFKLITTAVKIFTAAQKILNLVMAINPFVAIVLAIVGLAAAFVYAYKHSETFRTIVNRVMHDVKAVALAVVHWFTGPFVGFFVTAARGAVNGFHAFINFFTKTIPGIFKSVAAKIVAGWDAVKRFFTKTLPGWFMAPITYVKAHWRGVAQILITLLFGPIPALVWRYWGPITGLVKKVLNAIKTAARTAGQWFSVTFPGYFVTAYHATTGAFSKLGTWFKGLPGRIKGYFKGAGSWLVQHGKDIITGLGNGIKSAASKVTSWLEKPIDAVLGLLHKFINLINKIPGVNIPNVPTTLGAGASPKPAKDSGGGTGGLGRTKAAAHGGVLPGYTPGRDTVHAMLSPGEGILVPEAVRGLGPGFVHAANRHFSKRRGTSPGFHQGSGDMQKFLFGGIVKDVGKFGGWAGSKLKAGAEAVNPVKIVNAAFDAAVNGAFKLANAAAGAVPTDLGKQLAHGIVDKVHDAILHDGHADTKKLDMSGVSGSALVQYARQFAGQPYVWGGAEPGGFDCSGLTSYTMHHFGIPAPRTASQQEAWASPISAAAARPGDLIFYGGSVGKGGAHHVAFNEGGGMMFEAQQTGVPLKDSKIRGGGVFGRAPGNIASLLGGAGSFGTDPGAGGGNSANRALGQKIAASMGMSSQWAAIDYVASHESGWNNTAQNPSSTAYGIGQFLNGTWAAFGGKTSDAATQIRDMIQYMIQKYHSPNGAAAYWKQHNSYKDGGIVPMRALNGGGTVAPGESVIVGDGGPEIAHFANGGVVTSVKDTHKLLTQAQYESSIRPKAKPAPKPAPVEKHSADQWAKIIAQQIRVAAQKAARVARKSLLDTGNGLVTVIMHGMNGTASSSQIQAATNDVIHKIDGAFKGSRKSTLVDYVNRENRQLQSLASKRAKISSQIAAANSYATDVRGAAKTNAALTGLDTSNGVGVNTIQAGLKQKLQQTKQFNADIKTLSKKGLSRELIGQLIDAGVDGGGEIARQLAKASPARVHQINATQRSIDTASAKLGKTASNFKFGANASVDFVAGLVKQRAKLHREASLMGEQFARTIRLVFHLKGNGITAATHDSGLVSGWLMPNRPALNKTGHPEAILTPTQLEGLVGAAGRGGGASAEEIGDAVAAALAGGTLRIDQHGFVTIVNNANLRLQRPAGRR